MLHMRQATRSLHRIQIHTMRAELIEMLEYVLAAHKAAQMPHYIWRNQGLQRQGTCQHTGTI